MSAEGHNSVPAGQLRAFVERVERIEEEIATLNADKSEIYKEARGSGFDVKALRKVVAQRKLDPSEREERDAIFDLYWHAIHGVVEAEPRARARTREIIEEFPHDTETGELADEGSAGGAIGAVKVQGRLPDADSVEPSPADDFTPPAFLARERKPLRPLCQHPDNCAGYGSKTCHGCLKAAGVSYGSEAA